MKVNDIFSYIKEKATVIVISVMVIMGILLVSKVYLEDRIPDHTTYLGHADEEQFIYNLTDDDVIIQEFASPHDFDYATLHFSNHEQRIEGKTYIKVEKVYDDTLITYLELDNPSITYDEYVKLDFGGGGVKDELYRITISFEGMGEQGLGIMGYEYPGSFLPPCNLSLLYAVAVGTHSSTYKFQLFARIMVFYLCLVVLWGIYVFGKENWKAEQRFLAIAIPMGVFFLMFPAINPVYDGGHHLYTSYHYSNFLFREAQDDVENDIISLTEDENTIFFFGYQDKIDFHTDDIMLNQAYLFGKHFSLFSNNVNWVSYKSDGITYDASIMEYFPAIIAISICRFFHLGAYPELWIAKLFGMSFYIGLCYVAIRITPVKKDLLSFVSLIPMSLCTAAGISYDTIISSVCLLLTAMFIYCHYGIFNVKHLIALGICCFILGEDKGGVYLLLPLAFLTIPKTLESISTKRYRIWIIGVISGLLGILPTIINVYMKQIQNAFLDGLASTQKYYDVASIDTHTNLVGFITHYRLQNGSLISIRDVISNPLSMIKMIIISIIEQADDLLGQAMGNRVSFAETRTSWLIIIGLISIILLSAMQQMEGEKVLCIRMVSKIWIIVLLFVQIFGLYIIMLVTETGEYDLVVNGVQGRYFIPWIALTLLVLSNKQLIIKHSAVKYEYLVYTLVFCCYGISYLIRFV